MNLFNYFTGKNKIEHSKFGMSFQNLFSANFGELKPVATYDVLGGDKWEIGQNTLTKVAPMPAPAFTRIKQNFYSFFVPTQTVWKHWNDYITNGTAYLDTYGNNQTNQDITNQWSQPSIFVNDLQLHSKLANGWALPCFRMDANTFKAFANRLFERTDGAFPNLVYSYNQGAVLPTKDEIEKTAWSNYVCFFNRFDQLPDFFENIPYIHLTGTFSNFGSANTQGYKTATFKATGCAVCCDFHTAVLLYQWINNSDETASGLYEQVDSTLMKDASLTDTHVKDTAQYDKLKLPGTKDSSVLGFDFAIRYFCDPSSNNLRLDHSPFILDKYSYRTIDGTGSTLSSFKASQNLYDMQTITKRQSYTVTRKLDNGDYATGKVYIDVTTQVAGFYGRSFGVAKNPTSNGELWYVVNGLLFADSNPQLGNFMNIESVEQVPWVFSYNMDFLSCHCGMRLGMDNLESFGLTTDIRYSVVGDVSDVYTGPFSLLSFSPFVFDSSLDNFSLSFNSCIGSHVSCDVFFRFYPKVTYLLGVPQHTANNTIVYNFPSVDISLLDSFSLGYDAFGFLVYQAKQVSKLLDAFNISQEGFTARSWEDYAGELINALPFFSYSKIWNDYFRNKTTSSAELDFCETNGVAFIDKNRLAYLRVLKGLNVPLSPQVLNLIDDNVSHSWVIPMSTAPKSGLSNYTTEFTSNDRFLFYCKNEFHYYNIQNYQDLFCLLSGFQITDQFVSHILDYVDKVTYDSVRYIRFRGMLLDNIYLPNYYNGLLHMKYQNFSKDYFSSAMLDPMHGANDVALGDTISELRTEIAEQSFWERFAMARSVKHAFQSLMGTTPTHIEFDKPLLLGMDHIPINIGEVIQTSQSDITPQGRRTGLAAAHGSAGLCKKRFDENGYIIVLSSFTVEQQYSQGLEYMWTPFESFLDYPWIQLAHIGNESIPLRQLKYSTSAKYNYYGSIAGTQIPLPSADGSRVLMDGRTSPLFIRDASISSVYAIANIVDQNGVGDDAHGFDEIFGYIPRNSAYKFKLDQVHGAFRNQMDYWQTFRKFYKKPMLTHEFVNWEFVADDGDLNRLFAVEDENISDKFYVDCYINASVSRALPYVNIPSTK